MNRSDHCSACGGGGLAPAQGCTCSGNVHTCLPAVCTVCDGAGARSMPEPRRARCAARNAAKCPDRGGQLHTVLHCLISKPAQLAGCLHELVNGRFFASAMWGSGRR